MDQPLTLIKTSAADVKEKEEAKQEEKQEDSENDSIITEAEGGEAEDEDEEVMLVGEVKKEEMVEGAEERKPKKRAGRDGDHWGSTDHRAEEVKDEV